MIRRIFLVLFLPLLLGCQKQATAQASNAGCPIITDLAWVEDHRDEQQQRMIDLLRELYTPLSQSGAELAWKFQDADFVRRNCTAEAWKKLENLEGKGYSWKPFTCRPDDAVTVEKERMLLGIMPRKDNVYEVRFLDCGDLNVILLQGEVKEGKARLNGSRKEAFLPVSYEVAFGSGGKMLGRVVAHEKDGYKLRYAKEEFFVSADTVTIEVRSAYKGQGRLYPEALDSIRFYAQPSTASPVVWTHRSAQPFYTRYDCLGYAKGWFTTKVDGQECYVRVGDVHWMYYYNSREKRKNDTTDKHLEEIVEEIAQFPGGDKACLAFLQKHIQIPKLLTEYGLGARVIVSFIIAIDGNISNAKVLKVMFTDKEKEKMQNLTEDEQTEIRRLAEELLKTEALRVTSLMPCWKPARLNGKEVKSRYNLPIMFKQQ